MQEKKGKTTPETNKNRKTIYSNKKTLWPVGQKQQAPRNWQSRAGK
jgi:hypothetical protein